ncbi:hypothetical protein ACKFKH_33210, partial [Phormidesmis sp. 146-20]
RGLKPIETKRVTLIELTLSNPNLVGLIRLTSLENRQGDHLRKSKIFLETIQALSLGRSVTLRSASHDRRQCVLCDRAIASESCSSLRAK